MITAVACQKGGTGKTTTALSLASGLARKEKKVLLIDLDSQANSSKVLVPDYIQLDVNKTVYMTILKRKPLIVHPTSVPNLSIVPSHILMSETDVELTTAKDHREARLKTELDKIKDQYDYVFLDCPPALSWLTINAFTASDKVMVVIEPGYFELDSVVQINKTLEETRELFNPRLELQGYLFNKSDTTLNSKVSLSLLRQTYTNKVFNTIIPRNVDLKDAPLEKKDIWSYNPNSKGADAYSRLIEELYEKES